MTTDNEIASNVANAIIEDLKRLESDYDKYFENKNRTANRPMRVEDLHKAVNRVVTFKEGIVDVQGLVCYVDPTDKALFGDVCRFVYQIFEGKPMGDIGLKQFNSLLVYFLVRSGF